MSKILALCTVAGFSSIAFADQTIDAHLIGSAPIGQAASFGSQEDAARYDNTTNFVGQAFSNGGASGGITRLVADDISRTGTAGENLTEFSFSVTNLNTFAVSARPRIRFYANDGASGGPGTVLAGYTFNPISFGAGSVQLFTTGQLAGGAALPTNFWLGITYDNVGTNATDSALNLLGQGIFNPPTLGSSADAFFQTSAAGSFFANNPAGGQFNFGGNPVGNFGWRVSTTPTPGAMALLGLGGLAAGRRRR